MSPEDAARFRQLIDADAHTEAECTEFLTLAVDRAILAARHILLPTAYVDAAAIDSATLRVTDREVKLKSGRLDVAIIFEANTGDRSKAKRCVVWEMKAPQLAPFKAATASRWGATAELTSAEDQLLHYVAELKQSGIPLGDGTSLPGTSISAGGIIIGRYSHVPADNTAEKALYFQAKQIRQDCFYNHNTIRLFNWDYVYDFVTRS